MDLRVQAAIAFMNANLDRRYTCIDIARAVRLSPTHLRELFKSEMGTSMSHYRRELQLQRAEHLLGTTFLSVKEIADCVGIDGVSHFIRSFRKAYGITPARYAERYRKIIQEK
jgi:transcriptional regulator GlxA family with amidase domain